MSTDKDRTKRTGKEDENRDPISGAPGAHPVGTGVGAAAGGLAGGAGAAAAAGAAAGTGIGGPVGTVAGAAVGAVVGGLAGKAIAERINPTDEDAYWREQYRREPYYEAGYGYDDYSAAYRTGYEGYGRWGGQGKTFNDVEPELRRDFEKNYGKGRLSWDKARAACRAAWCRVDQNLNAGREEGPPRGATFAVTPVRHASFASRKQCRAVNARISEFGLGKREQQSRG